MNVRRHSLPRIRTGSSVAAVTALGLVALAGCSTGTADTGSGGKVELMASFYPMEYLAKEIGGEHVAVTGLTEPGVEPHDLEIGPQQTAKLGEADMMFYLKGLQPAVDEAVEQSGVKNAVDAATLTGHESESAAGHGGGHAEEGHADEGHAEEKPPADDGHGHESGTDPHIWLDPVKYAAVAEGLGKELEKADPDHAADYAKNTEALVGKLEALDQDFEHGLENRTTDTFITTHAAFGHLAERYGLDQEAISGVDPESEPSPARMKELHAIAEKEKVSTVFFETLVSGRTAKTLAADAGLRTDVLDPIEGITDKSAGDDYLEIMRANLAALQKALGAK